MEKEETPAPAPAPEPAAGPGAAGGAGWRILGGLLIAAALGVSAWVYHDSRTRLGATQEELAQRLRAIEEEARLARAAAREAQEAAREMQSKVAALEARVADALGQQAALESLYQDLSRNRDEWQLAEIEQVLAIAQQQLQLSGNVRAALLALQLAESRLALAERPQFQPVRRALERDIERLGALPATDVVGMSARLDGLLAAVDSLPLALEARLERPAPAPAPAPGAGGALARFGASLWRDLKELVIVRRVGSPEPPLLPPGQAYFLRENLRLRLLGARLALLARNQDAYAADLGTAAKWLERYFDARSPAAREARAEIEQLRAAPVGVAQASIEASLDAVRAFKARRERK
ncbi:MAG: uroporphyrinogen-III C-methyltransferase [Burkholderiales bacterium]